ncbi:MAG TPA: sigma-70 family RNA polymerase sigma factor [Planctomycetota bacterium]|nr:sigma-70 family RNA polymerase sigma factor [Planctomycetota bacterium]
MEESGTARKVSPPPPAPDAGTPESVAERSLEEELLDRWRAGDREAGGRLLEGQRNLVFWTCRRHGLRTEEEIADLYQEVVLRISRTLPRLRIERSFAAYVRRTTENTIADRGRTPPVPAPLEEVAEPADPRPSTPDLALREAVERCRGRLTPLEDAVYERRFVQGQEYEEVARRLGKTANHVGVTLFRLVRKMKRCLEASGYGTKP